MGFHEATRALIDKLERANDALINMAQMEMMEKEKFTTLTWTLEEFTKRFGAMETKLDMIIACHTGGGASARPPHLINM